jgi:hypothetical protein
MDEEETPRAGFELDRRTCSVLLATERVGRLVTANPDLDVLPVRFTLHGEQQLAVARLDGRSPPGEPGDRVVIEVDGVDEGQRVGWSVVVHGRLLASASAGRVDVAIVDLTGRWVSWPRPLPPLDGRAYL